MQFVELPSAGWDEDVYCEFPTARTDSSLFANPAERYDVILAIRHTEEYPYRDLYLNVESNPQAQLPKEVHLTLAGNSGKWTGKGLYGLYTVTDTLARDIPLPALLNASVGQNMRRGNIPGIVNVGLIIQRSKP
ncbi:MAG: gliding motility lipoprotein GldH [Bacteroidales bacterium]|nr:gliding motility lipoprotein GldH [Bacteroidales bacterium]